MVLGQRGHPSETNFKRSRPRRLWDPLSLTEKEKNSKTAAFRFEEACRRLKRNKSHMLGCFGFFFINSESAPMFIAILFTMAQTKMRPQCPTQ